MKKLKNKIKARLFGGMWLYAMLLVFSSLLSFTAATYASVPVTVFSDIKPTDWYYSSVKFASERGMVNGTSAATFGPNDTMTRAQFVTILGRMDGVEDGDVHPASGYTDVPASQYYTSHINWAYANNVSDASGTSFRPNDNITREEMVVIIGKYLAYRNVSLPNDPAAPSAFGDAKTISSAALPYAEALRVSGVVVGDGNANLNPKNNMTRAEGVTVFKRVYDKLAQAGIDMDSIDNGNWFRAAQSNYTISLDDSSVGIYDFVLQSAKDRIAEEGYWLSIRSISDRTILNTKDEKFAPRSTGTVTITWLCNTFGSDGVLFASTTITVVPSSTVYPDHIIGSVGKSTLEVGETTQFIVDFLPSNTTEKGVEYSSDKYWVATVSATGEIKAVGAGTVVLQARSVHGPVTKVEITVNPKPVKPVEPLEPPVIDNAFITAMNDEMIRLINIEREAAGLTGMSYASYMQASSTLRAEEMLSMNELTHTRPNGETSRTAFKGVVGDYTQVFECAVFMTISNRSYAKITPEEWASMTVKTLMKSPSHKAILMKSGNGFVDFAAGLALDWENEVVYFSANSYYGK